MHYAEFAEDEVSVAQQRLFPRPCCSSTVTDGSLLPSQSAALLAAIKEYEANKWKVIGQKLGKPAKVRTTITLIFFLSFFGLLLFVDLCFQLRSTLLIKTFCSLSYRLANNMQKSISSCNACSSSPHHHPPLEITRHLPGLTRFVDDTISKKILGRHPGYLRIPL